MAFAMAGLRAGGPIDIKDCANVNTSFPDFAGLAGGCGLSMQVST
jgi:3-phosphoshikimate 1-carboxyvinyltransferase